MLIDNLSLLLEAVIKHPLPALNEKVCTGGAHFRESMTQNLASSYFSDFSNFPRERDRSVNPAMHHRLVTRSLFYFNADGASLIEAESAFRVANSPGIITGQREVKGGWGGGVNVSIVGDQGGKQVAGILQALGASGLNGGLSYGPGSGLSANLNFNSASGLSLGMDYNFSNHSYGVNASADAWHGKGSAANPSKHHAGLSLSARSDGSASVDAYYNYGNEKIPPQLRGHGGTLSFSNDGSISTSVQVTGATAGTLTYANGGFQPISLNSNFQNEFNQGLAAENAQNNFDQMKIQEAKTIAVVGMHTENPLFSKADIDTYLPKDESGNIDVKKAQPEVLLAKWDAYKAVMSNSKDIGTWQSDISQAGEKAGVKIQFNGDSPTTTFGKFVAGIKADVLQSFGIANDGTKMVDSKGVLELTSCFVAGTQVHTKDGTKSIETLKIGDVVQSWNETTNTFENKRVTETFVHEMPQLFYLELDGEEGLHTTWNHPFRRRIVARTEARLADTSNVVESALQSINLQKTETRTYEVKFLSQEISKERNTAFTSEWVKVKDLSVGDQVLQSDGGWATVTDKYYYNTEPTKVYNLEVEDNHTYVVGELGIVVHNYNNAQEAMFGGFKKLSNDVYDVAKRLAGMEGGAGNEVYQKAVQFQQEVKETNSLRETLNKESNILVTKQKAAEASMALGVIRNSEFLKAIHDPKSDNVPGIADLRKQLKGVDPSKGFAENHLKSVSAWLSSSGTGFGISNMGAIQTNPMKGYIVSAALSISSAKERGDLVKTIHETKQQLTEHKINEDRLGQKMIERSEKVKSDIVKLIQEKHHNDPKYAEVLVEHGFVKKDTFNPNEHKVTYDEKLKALGDKVKPETRKQLAEYDRKITDLRVSQNKHEAESYAQWNKDHPNEPYKRGPADEKRRNDMVAMQKTLEKERALIINRDVAPFAKEPELHQLEKLADANGLNDKQKTELTNLKNEKKTHETNVAALLDRDASAMETNLNKLLGKPEVPKDFKAVVKEADTRKSYDKYMDLSAEQASERTKTVELENDAKNNSEAVWLKSKGHLTTAESDLAKIEKSLSKLNPGKPDFEAKRAALEEQRKTASDKVVNLDRDHQEYTKQKNKAFETVNKREDRESKELIAKLGNQNVDKIEKNLVGKKKELAEAFLNDSKDPDKKVKELTKEITKLTAQKDELKDKMAAAIQAIDDKRKSSEIVIGTVLNDMLPDSQATFLDVAKRKAEWVEKNLTYMQEELYKGEDVEYTVSGNQVNLEDGVINLGSEHSNQFKDYGASVKIISDEKKEMFGRSNGMSYDEKTGKYVYDQSGRNTCQSYSLLQQLLYLGVRFRDSGRQPIHELTRMEFNLGLTAEMSTNTRAAYEKLIELQGLKVVELGSKEKGVETSFANIKAALRRGEIINAGMYIDGPVNGEHRAGYDADFNKLDPSKGHRVDIVGFDDKRGEWIVNDSARPNQMIRYKYNDYELGHHWSMVIRKK
ncbi:TIGR04388 family protein [Leptospira sp. WS92.C1]